jgi:hypothetical protein
LGLSNKLQNWPVEMGMRKKIHPKTHKIKQKKRDNERMKQRQLAA